MNFLILVIKLAMLIVSAVLAVVFAVKGVKESARDKMFMYNGVACALAIETAIVALLTVQ